MFYERTLHDFIQYKLSILSPNPYRKHSAFFFYRTSILFVAIADNSLYGSKLSIFILCQNQLGY